MVRRLCYEWHQFTGEFTSRGSEQRVQAEHRLLQDYMQSSTNDMATTQRQLTTTTATSREARTLHVNNCSDLLVSLSPLLIHESRERIYFLQVIHVWCVFI